MLNLIASLLTVASVLQLKKPCWSVPKEEGGGFIYSLAPPVRITAVFITEGRFLFFIIEISVPVVHCADLLHTNATTVL